jgi:hypothetical protein
MKIKIFVAALLSVFFILALTTALRTSGTCDEIAHHIPVGYVLLSKWDFKMDTSQPPLARYIVALPLKIFMKLNLPDDKNEWRREDRASFGRDFFYKYNNSSKKMILLARIPVILIGMLCGVLLFIWTSSVYGEKAGLLGLFLYCFSPVVLAHAALATTDMVAAFFIFLSVYAFWKFLKDPMPKNVVFSGIMLGLAQLSKYNAILLYPIFLLLLLLDLWSSNKHGFKMLRKLAFIIIISIVLTWAGYGFDFQPILKDAMRVQEKLQLVERVTGIKDFLLTVPVPLGAHILGLLGVFRHSHEGHATFFFGNWSSHGNIFYFLIAFLVKNPLPMLIFLLAGLSIMFKNGIKCTERAILITIAAFFAVSSLGNIQIGVRHILPLFPFCFMIAGRSVELASRKFFKIVIAALVTWQVAVSLAAWPNYISYFNELAGGSKNGYKILRDSNVDWGQDLPALADYMKRNNITMVTFKYFGEADPAAYGVSCSSFQPDDYERPGNKVYAISAQYLEGVEWARGYRHTATAGNSIFLYDLRR